MNLSSQKDNLQWKSLESVDLLEEKLFFKSGEVDQLSLEKIWTGFVFLKAMGFESVKFRTGEVSLIGSWLERIESYQQSYLEDPESILPDECAWNEIDENNLQTVVECVKRSPRFESRPGPLYAVPPMEAPLSVEANALRAFLHEVDHQKDEDILLRLQAILHEYQTSSSNLDPQLWTSLVADIISVALDAKLLDKAVKFSEEHRASLAHVWEDQERSLRLLSAYEPRSSTETQTWSKVFESLHNERLIQFFIRHLGSKAGPQIIRLLSYRASQDPEHLVKFCFNSESSLQKLLLQSLSTYWGPQHYHQLYNALLNELNGRSEVEMIQAWLQALLQSYKTQAFMDLKKIFSRGSLKERIFKSHERNQIPKQKALLLALAEFPSAESLSFLKEVKPNVKAEVADEVERLIQTHQARKLI